MMVVMPAACSKLLGLIIIVRGWASDRGTKR